MKVTKVQDITLKPDASILICGKRRCEKTVIATNILHELTNTYDYRAIVLFSDTIGIECNGSFDNIVNKKLCFKSD